MKVAGSATTSVSTVLASACQVVNHNAFLIDELSSTSLKPARVAPRKTIAAVGITKINSKNIVGAIQSQRALRLYIGSMECVDAT
jgi:hypothetical protein